MDNIGWVYMIANSINGKVYIGSTNNLRKRLSSHYRTLSINGHHNPKLQSSFNYHGEDNFNVYVVHYGIGYLDMEQFYLDNHVGYVYNISMSCLSPMLGRKHSDSSKVAMSTAHMGNSYNLGNKYTPERRLALSARMTGTKRSVETKKKMSDTAKRINAIDRCFGSRYVEVYDSYGVIFRSSTTAAIHHGVSPQTVCDILKGRHSKTRKGVSFEYL